MKRKQSPTTRVHVTSGSESGRITRVRPESYETQLEEKAEKVRTLFQGISHPEMRVYRSPDKHYRQRCEFRLHHDDEACYYVMFERKSGSESSKLEMTRIDTFPAASELINELMTGLMTHVHRSPILRRRLYSAAFHTTLTKQAMITLVYHKKLSEEWRLAAEDMASELSKQTTVSQTVNIIGLSPALCFQIPNDQQPPGRSKKQKVVIGVDYVIEKLLVNGRIYTYKQAEGCFSQPNGHICTDMLSWAQQVTTPTDPAPMTDLLELYCGNCNFTIPLSLNFRKVIATEVSRTSVQAGQYNLEQNTVNNVLLGRMSSEEFVEKWESGDLGRRLSNERTKDLELSTIFVDPPRAGLDEKTVELLKQFENILYISCNPTTLHANIFALKNTHTIMQFALFDQFPYTGHIECGLYLKRKDD